VSTHAEWLDRQGKMLSTVAAPPQTHIVAIAPDNRQVAFARIGASGSNLLMPDQLLSDASIWLMDSTGAASRFSFTSEGATGPIWSRDRRETLFSSISNGAIVILRRADSGAAKERLGGTVPGTAGASLGD